VNGFENLSQFVDGARRFVRVRVRSSPRTLVIPAKAGIPLLRHICSKKRDPRLRGGDNKGWEIKNLPHFVY